jgi:ribosome-binding factor A
MSTTADDWIPGASLDYKLSQLCRQVEEAVAMGLFASHNPLLRDLCVIDVTPLRGAARLRVRVTTEDSDASLAELEQAVDRARGYLRAEAAAAISRKRAPELVVELVPPELVPELAPKPGDR